MFVNVGKRKGDDRRNIDGLKPSGPVHELDRVVTDDERTPDARPFAGDLATWLKLLPFAMPPPLDNSDECTGDAESIDGFMGDAAMLLGALCVSVKSRSPPSASKLPDDGGSKLPDDGTSPKSSIIIISERGLRPPLPDPPNAPDSLGCRVLAMLAGIPLRWLSHEFCPRLEGRRAIASKSRPGSCVSLDCLELDRPCEAKRSQCSEQSEADRIRCSELKLSKARRSRSQGWSGLSAHRHASTPQKCDNLVPRHCARVLIPSRGSHAVLHHPSSSAPQMSYQ